MNSILGTLPSGLSKLSVAAVFLACQLTARPGCAESTVSTQRTTVEKAASEAAVSTSASPSGGPSAANKLDEQVIRAQANEFAKAYAAGDAEKIASLWSLDCSFTDADGKRYHGRDSILKLYRGWFRESGAQPLTVNIDSLAFPSAEICLEQGTTVVGASDKGRYTVVHQKLNGEWKMLNVTETMYEAPAAETIGDLAWMAGAWSIKTAKTEIRLYVTPIAHGHFLAMRFCDLEGENEIPQSFQLIGTDPQSGHLVSWHFGEDGGYGNGHWHRVGDKWSVETRGLTPDGRSTTAIYIYESKDNGHFFWSSIDRTVDGQPVADRRPVEAVRIHADEKPAANVQ
jgi:uncharacterized protein (TIGR02246 family)